MVTKNSSFLWCLGKPEIFRLKISKHEKLKKKTPIFCHVVSSGYSSSLCANQGQANKSIRFVPAPWVLPPENPS